MTASGASSAPLISVVTACWNSAATIADTLASVREQVGTECEHLIADGGSTDATLELVATGLRPGGQVLSGPDTGIADAMNKGLALASGEWLLFLQSDDYLVGPHVLAEAARYFRDDVDICGFPVAFGDAGASRRVAPRGANAWLNIKTGLNHQGTFIRRRLFERLGGYDTSFRVAMDYEWFLRAYRAGARFACHGEPVVALMRDTGVSSQLDWDSVRKRLAEERRVHDLHQLPWQRAVYLLWWALYPRYRQVRAALR